MSEPKASTTILGRRLDALCDEHDLTYGELADRLDIHRSTLNVWRFGRRRDYLDQLCAAGDAFNVSVDWLLGRTEKREVTR